MPDKTKCPLQGEACEGCDRRTECDCDKEEARSPLVQIAKLSEEIGELAAQYKQSRWLSEEFGPGELTKAKKLRQMLMTKLAEMERMLSGWSREAGKVKAMLHGSGGDFGQQARDWEGVERQLQSVGVQLSDLSDMAYAVELPLDT